MRVITSNNRSRNSLGFFQRIGFELLWLMCWSIAILPHFVQFKILAPTIRFVIHHLIGYRKKVVITNLRNSFPEKSEKELREIRSNFYVVLSEIFVSILALVNKRSASNLFPKDDGTRCEGDLNALRERVATTSWIALTAHYGLWEYLVFWGGVSSQRLVGAYHPLGSRVFDLLFKRLRNHYKVSPMPATELLRFALRNKSSFRGETYVLGLIADQNPPRLPNKYWYNFLNQDTIFFDGGEKIALRTKMPVLFIYQKRVSAGKYTIHYREIWDGVEEIEPNVITTRYVALLDEVIKEEPSLWLWSHKRWKAKRAVAKPKLAKSQTAKA